jgi:hypothetical protein
MWILPKQLHTLDSVQDTEALNLDLQESSQLCAQSLFVRSKPSPLRTWLQKWKRDSWSQHLYGRILKPSLGKAFETEWTSLLEVTHANHSPQQESEQERKTQDTCGLGSQTEFGFSDQECASLKMSKDTSALDSKKSLESWKRSVMKRRGEYSLRVKSAHLTNGSGSSSWPTPQTSDQNGAASSDRPAHRKQLRDVEHGLGLPALANHSTDGSRQESWGTWATPATRDTQGPRGKAAQERKGNPMDTLPNQLMTTGGKLNPRWVETLMGLPIGWTMPSCTRPVTIEPMNCDCLETESSQPPQNEHLELF